MLKQLLPAIRATQQIRSGLNKYVEGREVGEIWGLETIGIAKSENEMQAHLRFPS